MRTRAEQLKNVHGVEIFVYINMTIGFVMIFFHFHVIFRGKIYPINMSRHVKESTNQSENVQLRGLEMHDQSSTWGFRGDDKWKMTVMTIS